MGIGKVFNNIYVKNLFAAIVVVLVLAFVVLKWLDSYTQHGKSVEVPDVKGLQVNEAAPFLTNRGLRYQVVDSIYDRNSVPGSIVETIPAVGTKVKEGRNIYLTINSSMARTLTVPEVIDLSQRQAQAILKSIGFESVDTKSVPGAYQDLVVGLESRGVEVHAGERIPVTTPLTLLVGSGTSEEDLSLSGDSTIVVTDSIEAEES